MFVLQKKEIAVTIESVVIGTLHSANTARKHMSNWKGLSIHTLTKEESIYQAIRKGKVKDFEQEKVTVAIVNIANHRPRSHFGSKPSPSKKM